MTHLSYLFLLIVSTADATPGSAKEALRPMNRLVGDWKATGTVDSKKTDKQFWTEKVTWTWQFQGDQCWLFGKWEKGKFFTSAELRYSLAQRRYEMKVVTVDQRSIEYQGSLTYGRTQEPILTLERPLTESSQIERLVFTLLHDNRHLYRLEHTSANGSRLVRHYQVGATKEGEAFAQLPAGPECIVSGGRGTMAVAYKGMTYSVCCSGCRDAFKEAPEKFIQEFEEKKRKKTENPAPIIPSEPD